MLLQFKVHIQGQRLVSEKLPKMSRRKITQDVDENHLRKEKRIFIQDKTIVGARRMVLNGLLAQRGTLH